MDVSGTDTTWKIELMISGLGRDITFNSAGNVIEVEQEVFPNSLAPEIQHAVEAASQGDHLTQVRMLSREGKFVGYEVAFNHKHHRREISIGPDGSSMKAD